MSLELEIRSEWEEVDRLREGVGDFLKQQGVDRDLAHAATMVTCELAENAIKYGDFGSGGQVGVQIWVESSAITIEVRNPVSSEEEEDLIRLDAMVQWIRGFQDPFEAYVERLREVSTQSTDDEESGLGLVRIAYEGQSILDFYVDESNTLAVSAVRRL